MAVRVSRTFEFAASPERVWEFIADPTKRAEAISVVNDFEVDPDGSATWHVRLPIPFIDTTVVVETRDTTRDPPRYVEFTGRSRVMSVRGKHTIEPTDGGCRLLNEFVVDGRIPGVERFFERNLDAELDNLEAALRRDLDLESDSDG